MAAAVLVACGGDPSAAPTGGGGGGGTQRENPDLDFTGALEAPIEGCAPEPLPATGDAAGDCVARINQLRAACQKLPPLARWAEGEACADAHAAHDAETGEFHSGFVEKICTPRGLAQNECPAWPSVEDARVGCLQAMWDEGPGEPFEEHGHYLNMSSRAYSKVACGFHTTPEGDVWTVQNFE